jgi:LysM repeat protein
LLDGLSKTSDTGLASPPESCANTPFPTALLKSLHIENTSPTGFVGQNDLVSGEDFGDEPEQDLTEQVVGRLGTRDIGDVMDSSSGRRSVEGDGDQPMVGIESKEVNEAVHSPIDRSGREGNLTEEEEDGTRDADDLMESSSEPGIEGDGDRLMVGIEARKELMDSMEVDGAGDPPTDVNLKNSLESSGDLSEAGPIIGIEEDAPTVRVESNQAQLDSNGPNTSSSKKPRTLQLIQTASRPTSKVNPETMNSDDDLDVIAHLPLSQPRRSSRNANAINNATLNLPPVERISKCKKPGPKKDEILLRASVPIKSSRKRSLNCIRMTLRMRGQSFAMSRRPRLVFFISDYPIML